MTGNSVSAWAGGLAAVMFVAIAALHAYWALGGIWPGQDKESLARTVVGGRPMPGPSATWVVAALLLAAALTVLAAGGLVALPLPHRLLRGAALLATGLLWLRGLVGFFDFRIRPATVGSPFARLNLYLYSPLCLVLGLLTYLAVSR